MLKRQETLYKLPLVLQPAAEGGYTVTCPILPELVTEGDTAREALSNVADALAALLEAYQHLGRPIPAVLKQDTKVLSGEAMGTSIPPEPTRRARWTMPRGAPESPPGCRSQPPSAPPSPQPSQLRR